MFLITKLSVLIKKPRCIIHANKSKLRLDCEKINLDQNLCRNCSPSRSFFNFLKLVDPICYSFHMNMKNVWTAAKTCISSMTRILSNAKPPTDIVTLPFHNSKNNDPTNIPKSQKNHEPIFNFTNTPRTMNNSPITLNN